MLCKLENTVLKCCLAHNKHIKSNLKSSLDIKVMFPSQCLACHLILQVSSQTNGFAVELRRCKCLKIRLWTLSFACLWKDPLTTLSSASGQETGKTMLFFQKTVRWLNKECRFVPSNLSPFFSLFFGKGRGVCG